MNHLKIWQIILRAYANTAEIKQNEQIQTQTRKRNFWAT